VDASFAAVPRRARSAFALVASLALIASAGLGCAHANKTRSLEGAKVAAESFFERIRWRDYRGAAELVVPDRREAFIRARAELRDDQDLSITDYQLENIDLSAEGAQAKVTARIAWMRLPSATERTETVVSELVLAEGTWYVERQDKGPFVRELGAPAKKIAR
jgi:hypothetical protein